MHNPQSCIDIYKYIPLLQSTKATTMPTHAHTSFYHFHKQLLLLNTDIDDGFHLIVRYNCKTQLCFEQVWLFNIQDSILHKYHFPFCCIWNPLKIQYFIYQFYIFENTVAWLSISVEILLDVVIEGYDYTTNKFKLLWQD